MVEDKEDDMPENKNEVPLKELVTFEIFQAIFEKMMENEDRRRSEGEE